MNPVHEEWWFPVPDDTGEYKYKCNAEDAADCWSHYEALADHYMLLRGLASTIIMSHGQCLLMSTDREGDPEALRVMWDLFQHEMTSLRLLLESGDPS